MLGVLCIVGYPVQLIREVFRDCIFVVDVDTLLPRFEALGYVLPHFDEPTHVVLTFCIKPGCLGHTLIIGSAQSKSTELCSSAAVVPQSGELTQRRRQRQRKRHLKINIWEMVTIFKLLLLPRILYC